VGKENIKSENHGGRDIILLVRGDHCVGD